MQLVIFPLCVVIFKPVLPLSEVFVVTTLFKSYHVVIFYWMRQYISKLTVPLVFIILFSEYRHLNKCQFSFCNN